MSTATIGDSKSDTFTENVSDFEFDIPCAHEECRKRYGRKADFMCYFPHTIAGCPGEIPFCEPHMREYTEYLKRHAGILAGPCLKCHGFWRVDPNDWRCIKL